MDHCGSHLLPPHIHAHLQQRPPPPQAVVVRPPAGDYAPARPRRITGGKALGGGCGRLGGEWGKGEGLRGGYGAVRVGQVPWVPGCDGCVAHTGVGE